jgi:hypothetical protein
MREARFFEGLDPKNYMAHFMIGNVYRDSGMLQDAVAPQRRAVELSGGQPQMMGWLGLNLALAGNSAEARSVLQRLQAIACDAYVSPTCFVWVNLGLGEIDDSFVWMDRAIDERDSIIIPIKTYPSFDPLRSDPRFHSLLRKMNLEP